MPRQSFSNYSARGEFGCALHQNVEGTRFNTTPIGAVGGAGSHCTRLHHLARLAVAMIRLILLLPSTVP